MCCTHPQQLKRRTARMGCGPSKKAAVDEPYEPAVGGKPMQKPVDAADITLAPAPEPEPDPPPAPIPCDTYKLDEEAAQCLNCPAGWLMGRETQGKKAGTSYFYTCSPCGSQWKMPPGDAKTAPEPTCTCGALKTAHTVCGEWDPQPGTEPPTCRCGFTKDDHSPCMNYRVNVAAENFGDCKCGFPKDAHEAAAFVGGAKAKKQERNSSDLREKMSQKKYADCPKYEVNLESANFGECKCGRPKAEHSPEALAKNAKAGAAAGTTRRDSGEMRNKFVQKAKVQCVKYEPDLTAGEFGVCKCGAKRGDHTDAALAADTGAKAAKQQDESDVRAGFVKRTVADCPRFELNMDPSAPFGTCVCGRPRAEHSAVALAADAGPRALVKKGSAEVRKEMEAKQEEIGTGIETSGAKTGVAFGIGNTVRTASEEAAELRKAINARAGGADKAAALNDFNEMMKQAAPAAAPAAA